MFTALLLVAGCTACGTGVWLATERPRPASLGGMLLAPAGLLIALWGAARWLAG